MMWPDSRLIELLGIEHPIVLAPMAGFATAQLATSVCEAGGLGSVGCAALKPEAAAKAIEELRQVARKPINANFFCHSPAKADAVREQAWRARLSPYFANWKSTRRRCPGSISRRSARPCARRSRQPGRRW
jgi:nitronate monooxygenase